MKEKLFWGMGFKVVGERVVREGMWFRVDEAGIRTWLSDTEAAVYDLLDEVEK
jgi:hypothetical protein